MFANVSAVARWLWYLFKKWFLPLPYPEERDEKAAADAGNDADSWTLTERRTGKDDWDGDQAVAALARHPQTLAQRTNIRQVVEQLHQPDFRRKLLAVGVWVLNHQPLDFTVREHCLVYSSAGEPVLQLMVYGNSVTVELHREPTAEARQLVEERGGINMQVEAQSMTFDWTAEMKSEDLEEIIQCLLRHGRHV